MTDTAPIEERFDLENVPDGFPDYAPKGIPLEDIIELRSKALTTSQIATLLGCSQANVARRLKQADYEVQGIDNFKKHRADILALKQRNIINSLDDEDIQKASPYQKVGMFGILYDKERTERGESNANIAIHQVHTEAGNIRAELEKRGWVPPTVEVLDIEGEES